MREMDTSVKMALGFAVVALSITGAWIAWPKPTPRAEVPPAAVLQVTPEQLASDLDTNIVKARDTFEGKTVRFTGPINMILDLKKNKVAVLVFHVEGKLPADVMVGYGASFRNDIAALKEGDSVTCVGVVDELNPGKGSIYIKGSELTK